MMIVDQISIEKGDFLKIMFDKINNRVKYLHAPSLSLSATKVQRDSGASIVLRKT